MTNHLAYFLFALTLILQPVSQILERKGMSQIGKISDIGQMLNIHTILSIITNPYILVGVFLSACGLALWLIVLSSFKVSYIYPFGAIGYIVLALLSFWILHESISVFNWTGIMLIVGGAFLLNVR